MKPSARPALPTTMDCASPISTRTDSTYKSGNTVQRSGATSLSGPYYALINFDSTRRERTGKVWACGYASERDAGMGAIDYCKQTGCTASDHYLKLNVGSALDRGLPQMFCVEGHYNITFGPGGSLGPISTRAQRGLATRDGSDERVELSQDQALCADLARHWRR